MNEQIKTNQALADAAVDKLLSDGIGVLMTAVPAPNTAPHTICEVCANACGGCRWSEHGVQQPVPGWEAVRNDILYTSSYGCKRYTESYIVLDCPQLVLERKWMLYYQKFCLYRQRIRRERQAVI